MSDHTEIAEPDDFDWASDRVRGLLEEMISYMPEPEAEITLLTLAAMWVAKVEGPAQTRHMLLALADFMEKKVQ